MKRIDGQRNIALTANCPFCERLCGAIYDSTRKKALGIMVHTCGHYQVVNPAGQLCFMSDQEMEHYRKLASGKGFETDGDTVRIGGQPVKEFKD